jgi:SPP1 family predicted phage head-tail adaptor
MLAYRLRHRITIQELNEVQDTTTGAVSYEWETAILEDGTILDAVPAEVLTGAGREFIQSGATQGEIDARINMRWFPGLTQKMRVLWDTKVFNIVSIETDITARQEYRLKCKAGVSDGQ